MWIIGPGAVLCPASVDRARGLSRSHSVFIFARRCWSKLSLQDGGASIARGHCSRHPRRKSILFAAVGIDAFEPLETRRLLAAHIVGGGTYSSIQAAVDAASAGATITVDPGNYAEQVVIGKSVTLEGAMTGVDARSNARAAGTGETVCTGITLGDGTITYAFKVAASDVTIDGFTIQNESNTSLSTGAGIVIAPNISGTHIINNIIQNNCAGLYLANASASDAALIQHNKFLNNNNGATQANNGGRAIYTDGSISGGLLQNVTIDGNFFDGNLGPSNFQYQPAIGFESYTANSQTSINITNNVFAKNGKAVLSINVSHLLFDGNVVENHYDNASGALRFEGGDTSITITHNNFYADGAPAIRIDEKAVPNDNTNFVIQDNNIYRNGLASNNYRAGLVTNTLQYQGSVTASNNYWGASDGPSGLGSGSGDAIINEGINVTYQPYSASYVIESQVPWYGVAQSVSSPIQAEDFDHGPEGIASHDVSSGNSGGDYRPYQNVDISTTTDATGGYNLSSVSAGEWVEYSVNVAVGGTYTGQFRVANGAAGGAFHVELDGTNVSGSISVPNTGSNSTWQTISQAGVNLTSGQHILRLAFDTAASNSQVMNLNWFVFNLTQAQTPAAPTNVVAAAPTQTSIQLTWQDNSSNETGFIIERMTGSSGTWQSIITTLANITSYTDNTVLPGVSYTYRVRATNSGNDSTNALSNAIAPPATGIVYLSDLTWVSATNGWGPVEKDMSNGGQNAGDGTTITLNGVTYAKGLGAHAASDIVYNLNGQYSLFQSAVGADDETGATAGLDFQVYADGTLVWDSGGMAQTDPTQSFSLNMTGVQQLRLHLDDLDGDYSYDHGDWAGARLTQVQIPSAPTGLTATPVTGTEIDLSWTDVNGEIGYKVQRSTDNINFTQIGTTAANVTTYPDTTVSGTTTYYYRVIASGTGGDSQPSNVASSQPLQPPAAPTGLGATPITGTRIDLAWTDVATETGYKVQRSTDNVTFTQIGTTLANITTYSDTTVSGTTLYYYRVLANNAAGDSQPSNTASSQPLQAPLAPTQLVANALTPSMVMLSWTDVAGESGYKIERSTDNVSFTQIGTAVANATSYSDATAVGSTQYYYRIRATNAAGDSPYSNVATAVTPTGPSVPAAPTGLLATAASSSQIDLTWVDNSNNETGFKIERSPDGTSNWMLLGTVAAGTNAFSDSNGLAPSTTYYYRVRATNYIGDSGNSNLSNAQTQSTPTATTQNYIASGSTWKYLDNGSNQGTAWQSIAFNDSAWSSGAALLGYGDGNEATVVSYGSNPANKYITTYFRKSFTVADTSLVTAPHAQTDAQRRCGGLSERD